MGISRIISRGQHWAETCPDIGVTILGDIVPVTVTWHSLPPAGRVSPTRQQQDCTTSTVQCSVQQSLPSPAAVTKVSLLQHDGRRCSGCCRQGWVQCLWTRNSGHYLPAHCPPPARPTPAQTRLMVPSSDMWPLKTFSEPRPGQARQGDSSK